MWPERAGPIPQEVPDVRRAILDDPEQRLELRALTRNPDSAAAQAQAARGAEVVAADLDEQAFEGAYGAYLVTAFWEYNSVEREQHQARAMAAAAKATGLEHVIWSTLPDTRLHLRDDRVPTLHGRYKVPHFDSKAEAEAF